MWWDADIDALMQRTSSRPIPSGRVTPEAALQFGLWLSVFSVIMLGLAANIAAATLLAFTIIFYAVIYTIWLKRRTPQNIVIGGASGAFPPMIGWLVATNGLTLEPILMFCVIFLWTPPHFWALALFVKSDYADAGVPMLPVVRGARATRIQIFIYTLAMAASSTWLALTNVGGMLTFGVSVVLNVIFIALSFKTLRRNSEEAEKDNFATEKMLFRHSLIYLFVLFGCLMIEAGLRAQGIGGW